MNNFQSRRLVWESPLGAILHLELIGLVDQRSVNDEPSNNAEI
jgi:hypothetical protein